ncbi:MAG: iron ABC transporter permease [Chloroflexi bacterium]|nr:iron ABC transporter permease [Chloroflexota bacterium]
MALGALVIALIAIVAVGFGSVAIPPLTVLKLLLAQFAPGVSAPDWPVSYETIVLQIRLPRVVLVALTGAALSISGATYQGLFRNPLADPYLIGVASGAGLGATVAVALGWNAGLLGATAVPLAAFAGATGSVVLVYGLGRVGRATPTTTLILAGVAIGTLMSSLSTFIMLSINNQAVRVLGFLLGGYGGGDWDAVTVILLFTLIGFAVMLALARPLNLLLLDEEQARQLGVDVDRVKLALIVAATLTTATAVSFSGLIGFVGLVVPHAVRLVSGADHRRLLPWSFLAGAGFLMLADLIARTALAPQELPLGIVTAFAGAPFFLYLLRRAKQAAYF